MKKLFALLIVVVFCSTMVLPIAAEEFVPSISYKDHPDVVGDPEIITPTTPERELEILVTPVSDAINTDPADRNEAEEELADVYEALTEGDMKLPLPDDDKSYVIRDLVEVSLIVKRDDPNEEPVFVDEDARVTLTFDLGVKPDTVVLVYLYNDDEWIPVEVTNNGDGTITLTIDKLGVLAFCVDVDSLVPPTFDRMNKEMTTWIVLMVVSTCAMIVMLAMRRKVCR